MPVGALIGGSLIGGIASSKSASKAADAQTQAASQANATQRYIFDRSVALTEPQRQAGMNALAVLNANLGIGKMPSFGPGGQMLQVQKNDAGEFDIVNQSGKVRASYDNRQDARQHLRDRQATFENSPGYQHQLDEGNKAIERMAAARGLRLSGGTLKAGADYASGLAAQDYGNYLNRLAGVAGAGQTAAGQQVSAGQSYANAYGQNALAAGNARASGYMNQANALNSTIGDVAGIYTMGQMGVFS